VLQGRLPPDEASAAMDAFRRRNAAELKECKRELADGPAAAAGAH